MMGFKPILGLRSPVHTLARMINPFAAPCLLQGVFHPNYMPTHRDAALVLGREATWWCFAARAARSSAVPANLARPWACATATPFEERWPPLMEEPRQMPDEDDGAVDGWSPSGAAK